MKINATYKGGTLGNFLETAEKNKDMTIDEFFNKFIDEGIDGQKLELDQVSVSA